MGDRSTTATRRPHRSDRIPHRKASNGKPTCTDVGWILQIGLRPKHLRARRSPRCDAHGSHEPKPRRGHERETSAGRSALPGAHRRSGRNGTTTTAANSALATATGPLNSDSLDALGNPRPEESAPVFAVACVSFAGVCGGSQPIRSRTTPLYSMVGGCRCKAIVHCRSGRIEAKTPSRCPAQGSRRQPIRPSRRRPTSRHRSVRSRCCT